MISAIRDPQPAIGFTLIELLVVITIIVVLLALLTPALDKAIYQAELVVCATTLRSTGSAVTMYATDYKRRYPARFNARDLTDVEANRITDIINFDDRPMLRPYLSINRNMNDVLTGEVDFDVEEDTAIMTYSPYNFYFGWRFNGHAAQDKLGDRFSWSGTRDPNAPTRVVRFSVLGADHDNIRYDDGDALAAHPDFYDGLMVNFQLQESNAEIAAGVTNIPVTATNWVSIGEPNRGAVDTNYVLADLSVTRIDRQEPGDERIVPVPTHANNNNWEVGNYNPLPPQ